MVTTRSNAPTSQEQEESSAAQQSQPALEVVMAALGPTLAAALAPMLSIIQETQSQILWGIQACSNRPASLPNVDKGKEHVEVTPEPVIGAGPFIHPSRVDSTSEGPNAPNG